jgi:hypothetical protein
LPTPIAAELHIPCDVSAMSLERLWSVIERPQQTLWTICVPIRS